MAVENRTKPNPDRVDYAAARKAYRNSFTKGQKTLRKKHGSPAEFAAACYQCVPSDISMGEARAAVDKYVKEWNAA